MRRRVAGEISFFFRISATLLTSIFGMGVTVSKHPRRAPDQAKSRLRRQEARTGAPVAGAGFTARVRPA
jgi:hypothetical protein